MHKYCTAKSPIKDTPKEDKPPNKGQAESTLVLAERGQLSTRDKAADPEGIKGAQYSNRV